MAAVGQGAGLCFKQGAGAALCFEQGAGVGLCFAGGRVCLCPLSGTAVMLLRHAAWPPVGCCSAASAGSGCTAVQVVQMAPALSLLCCTCRLPWLTVPHLCRPHKQVVEIAPAPGLDEGLRQALFDDAVKLAKHVGYRCVWGAVCEGVWQLRCLTMP